MTRSQKVLSRLFILVILVSFFVTACQPISTPLKTELKEAVSQPAIDQKPSNVNLIFLEIPARAHQNEKIKLVWKIASASPLTAVHTAIHYDTESHPGNFKFDVSPALSNYPTLTKEYAAGSFAIPGEFSTTIIIPAGITKLFLRAHVIIDGKNYWTVEREIQVLPEVQPESMINLKKFTIEGDDFGLYPSDITVKEGDNVELTFVSRKKGVYYGGLDFRAEPWSTTGTVKSSENKTVTFIATKTTEFKSYWPATGVLKATGKIIVQ